MIFLRVFVFIVCFLIFSSLLLAQTAIEKTFNAIYAKKLYTVEDGLTQGYITYILEDYHGYLWVGTLNGLNRFDGKTFETFTDNPSDSFSIKGQYVDQIIEDHLQRIWVVFNNGSISVFDHNEEHFYSVQLSAYLPYPEENYFKLISHKGEIWIQQKDKIGRITLTQQNKETAQWQANVAYITVLDEKKEEPFRLLRILFDERDQLWIGSVTKLLKIEKPYEAKDTLFAKNFPIPASEDSLSHFDILRLKNDTICFSTWQGDLFTFDEEKLIDHVRYVPANKHPGINTLETDVNGLKWLRNVGSLVLYDKNQDHFYDTKLESTFLYQSKEGSIWSGTPGYGLYHFSPKNSPFQNIGNAGFGIEPGQEIVAGALTQSRSDEIIMVDKEIRKLDEESGEWMPYSIWLKQLKESEEITNAFSYLEDSKGRNWVATNAGLYCQQKDGSVIVYKGDMEENDSLDLYYNAVLGVFEDNSQTIWALNSGFLHRFDEKRQRFLRYSYQMESRPAREDRLNSYLDHSNELWLVTELGLFVFDKSNSSFTQKHIILSSTQLENVAFSALHQDKVNPNKIWIGTKNKGLYTYDLEHDLWTHFSQKNGLLNNTIYAIAEDALNRIWVSTNNGIYSYSQKEKSWTNYRKENGIQGDEFNSRSFTKQADGRLFFGGMNGLTSFYPLSIQKSKQDRPIVLKSISFEKQIGDSSQLSRIKDLTAPIVLSFQDSRRIEFEFAWLNYNQPENHIYAYRLTENGNWIDLDHQNELSFYNLNTGDYTLQIKATDWLGNTNQSFLNVPFTILAPWYKTSWAYLTYVLLSIGLLTMIFRIRENRKRLKVEASFSRNEAERYKDLEQTKTRFFSNITHEFKTPLTLVIGPLEQLYKQAKESTDKSLISTAKKNAADLLYLINQLLDLNKMEQGKMPVKYSKGDMAYFVSEICKKSRHLAEVKNISLNFSAKPIVIENSFDSRKVERIVINLLSNALKFSEENTTVEVTLEQKGKVINLQVSDEGPGIPPEKMDTIFDQFYQLDGSEKRKFGGTGIGLALVKEYAELLGAVISVKNNPSKGCAFEVVFPLVETEHSKEIDFDIDISGLSNLSVHADVPVLAEAAQEGVPLILIAEDNVELNDYLKGCLANYTVLQAYDGKEALEIAMEHLPDLILSDQMMPEMTGIELCAEVKGSDLTAHIPVVILSAKSAIESRIEGLEVGADDYLSKPFNQNELLVRIENLIELRKALRERYESSMQRVKSESSNNVLRSKDRVFIEMAEAVIEANLDNVDFDVSDFVDAINLSRSQAHRKIKALTNVSVSAFIRSYRLKRAMELMQKEGLIVKEAAYRVGFNSPNYFSKCFHEHFGIPPTQIAQ